MSIPKSDPNAPQCPPHFFHPVIGDTTYGDGKQNGFFRQQLGCGRMLLHSTELSFDHPLTGAGVRITSPPDDAFGAVLRKLGWETFTEAKEKA